MSIVAETGQESRLVALVDTVLVLAAGELELSLVDKAASVGQLAPLVVGASDLVSRVGPRAEPAGARELVELEVGALESGERMDQLQEQLAIVATTGLNREREPGTVPGQPAAHKDRLVLVELELATATTVVAGQRLLAESWEELERLAEPGQQQGWPGPRPKSVVPQSGPLFSTSQIPR